MSTKTQESDLYGSTLLVVEFHNASSGFASLYGLPLVLLLALLFGIFSRKDNKLDRKFFFSKKGFLFNTVLTILLFMIGAFAIPNITDSRWLSDETAYAESELELLYIDKKTDLNTIIAFAPDETPASFESRLIASQDIEIQQVLNTNFDHKCGWQDEVSPSFYGYSRLLIVPVNQIKQTIDLYKSNYSPGLTYCEQLISRERYREKEEQRERAKKCLEQREQCLKDGPYDMCSNYICY